MSLEKENDNPTSANGGPSPLGASPLGVPAQFWGMPENTFCMLMHLSQFASCVLPGAGIVLPIVMWATNKDQSPVIDQHGKNLLNFIISMFIYIFASIILIFVIVGIITTIALVIVGFVFPIIAAVKANNGEYWPYPLCIRFFK